MKITARFHDPLISQRDLDNYIVEVGILPDTFEKKGNRAKSKKAGFKSVAGVPARYRGKNAKATIGEIAGWLDERYDWTGKAVDNENNADLNNVAGRLGKLFIHDTEGARKRYLNACIAFVSNPILRRELGSNAASTIKQKGFDHAGMDTGKFFKSINAAFVKK
jgi:hypothetical protein